MMRGERGRNSHPLEDHNANNVLRTRECMMQNL